VPIREVDGASPGGILLVGGREPELPVRRLKDRIDTGIAGAEPDRAEQNAAYLLEGGQTPIATLSQAEPARVVQLRQEVGGDGSGQGIWRSRISPRVQVVDVVRIGVVGDHVFIVLLFPLEHGR